MHIPITVSNKKIPKGTRIIKQKLTKKLTQKKKIYIYPLHEGLSVVVGGEGLPVGVGGERSPDGWKAKGYQMGVKE